MAKIFYVTGIIFILIFSLGKGDDFLSEEDMNYLGDITAEVIDSSRILPGANFPGPNASFGPNNSGITLIRPGGRDCYPSFWIRDYAMSIESGFINDKEQLDMLRYTAARQADSTWISSSGSIIPLGSIPDHIRIKDGLPVFFPGTYSFEGQGNEMWRLPPYGDQFFFIHMAWNYIRETGNTDLLEEVVKGKSVIDRLEQAFWSVPTGQGSPLLKIDQNFQTCDFGFRDVITMTGKVCFGSILKYRAAIEMAELLGLAGKTEEAEKYNATGGRIADLLPAVFMDDTGFLRASTGMSNQPDVWATAFAVYLDVLKEPFKTRACRTLAKAYRDGTIACEGQIRHVPTTDDFSDETAWEKAAATVNRYQNGAYWATPTGWVCYAIYQVDRKLASKLAGEYIRHMRKTDFRINPQTHGGPYECIYPDDNYSQNPVYMTSVSTVYPAFKRIIQE